MNSWLEHNVKLLESHAWCTAAFTFGEPFAACIYKSTLAFDEKRWCSISHATLLQSFFAHDAGSRIILENVASCDRRAIARICSCWIDWMSANETPILEDVFMGISSFASIETLCACADGYLVTGTEEKLASTLLSVRLLAGKSTKQINQLFQHLQGSCRLETSFSPSITR